MMKTKLSAGKRFVRTLLAVGIALGFFATHASAQVNYVRELIGTENLQGDLLLTTQAPTNFSDPLYASGNTGPYLVDIKGFQEVNSQTGVVESTTDFPDNLILNQSSLVALAGLETRRPGVPGAEGPMLFLTNAQRFIVTFTFQNRDIANSQRVLGAPGIFSSLAAESRTSLQLSLIAGALHFSLDSTTGVATETTVMSSLDSTLALYQSFAPNGLLYVLDYGNERMVSFDPDNAFALVGSFDLNPGVTTANLQFAIGITGSFYLADGLGGGSYYDSTGQYQGLFLLPEGTVGDPYSGASYVSTDAEGYVYVFDSATGFHQYQDMSVVPEPSSAALLLLAGAALGFRRDRGGNAANSQNPN